MAFGKVIEGSVAGFDPGRSTDPEFELDLREESWSKAMPRVCALTGKKVQYGHNVSHSKRATNRRFEPNIQKVRLLSEVLGQQISLNIATRTLRTVQKKGGLDGFLLATDDSKLQPEALRLKNKIRRKLSGR